jgi:hypothetical protein
MKKQVRITKKIQTPTKPEKISPFEKYRGIGNGQTGSGRMALLRAIRELRGCYSEKEDARSLAASIRQLRHGATLGKLSIRQLIDEGRR